MKCKVPGCTNCTMPRPKGYRKDPKLCDYHFKNDIIATCKFCGTEFVVNKRNMLEIKLTLIIFFVLKNVEVYLA